MANENYEGFDLTIYNLFTLLREMYYTRGETETNFLSKSGGTLGGSLTIQGNLTVQGNSYKIDTEDLVVKDYTITLAKDNDSALLSMVGMVVPKYDGTNYGFFGWDADGYAYVGDLTDYDGSSAITLAENTSLQKIATIKDTATGTTSDDVMVYDQTNKVFKKAPSGRYVIEDNELVASNDNKALYNIGAFDSVSGNTITRQTGYYTITGNENWIQSNNCYRFYGIANYTTKGTWDTSADIKINANIPISNHADLWDGTTTNGICIDEDGCIDIGSSTYANVSQLNGVILQYKLATSYTEQVIEGESILPLDTTMAQMIRQDVVDGLNLFDNALLPKLDYTTSGNVYADFRIEIWTTPDTSGSQIAYFNSYNEFTRTIASGNYYFRVGLNGNAQDDKYFIPTPIHLESGTYTMGFDLTLEEPNHYIVKSLMLVKADHSYPYSEYNQKEHITNEEATLLKQEEEKCSNLFDKNKVITVYTDWKRYGYFEVKPNTTYTISNCGGSGTSEAVTYVDNSYQNISFERFATSLTFTTPSNCAYIIFDLTDTTNADFMFNEGSKAKPYQEYNGDIVHKADIEPVLLWENPNPNDGFTNQTIDVKNISKFKFIVIGFKTDNGTEKPSQFIKVAYKLGGVFQYMAAINGTTNIYTREGRFESNGNQVYFYNGYYNTGESQYSCIPVVIYGTNVL